jgi:hypothetical protein
VSGLPVAAERSDKGGGNAGFRRVVTGVEAKRLAKKVDGLLIIVPGVPHEVVHSTKIEIIGFGISGGYLLELGGHFRRELHP